MDELMMSDVEMELLEIDEDIDYSKYKKISLTRLAAYGLSFTPLLTKGGKSGLYYASVAPGSEMIKKKGKATYVSTSKKIGGNNFSEHADLLKMPFDPVSLVVAISLSEIDGKLNEIKELQKSIIDYLEERDRAKDYGNLMTLMDIRSEFKYHWQNEKYKQNKHILVQEIKREAEHAIVFHRKKINKLLTKNSIILSNNQVLDSIQKLGEAFHEYRLNTYIYGFASFLEVLLLGDYQTEYVAKAKTRIEDYAYQYREMYTQSYSYLENLTDRTLEKSVYSGISSMNNLFGKAKEKLPIKLNDDAKFDKFLEENLVKRVDESLAEFTSNRQSNITAFSNHLDILEDTFNIPKDIFMDSEFIYINNA